jgi:N-acetylglucosamine-6-phosphate deacetylase
MYRSERNLSFEENRQSDVVIRGARTITSHGTIERSTVVIQDGRISAVGDHICNVPPGALVLDGAGCDLLPGFIDTHIHGCCGDEVMSADPEAILRMARNLCRHGVTSFLPTTIAAPEDELIQVIEACVEAKERQGPPEQDGARIAGIHLEGPYINPERKGAQPIEGIRLPDLPECSSLLQRGRGLVRIMTLAPEMPGGLDLICLLRDRDVQVAMGHTAADYRCAETAIELGATSATHLFNQMPPLHHRDLSLTTACLVDDRVTVEIITDGIHVREPMVELAHRAKGSEMICLITDSIAATDMPEGMYRLGPHEVRVKDGSCTLADGTLAGSVHTMDRALRNILRFTNCGIPEASMMLSEVPARRLGTESCQGSIVEGFEANLVLMLNGEVRMTMVGGQVCYSAPQPAVGR